MLAEARVEFADHEEHDAGDDEGYVEHDKFLSGVEMRFAA